MRRRRSLLCLLLAAAALLAAGCETDPARTSRGLLQREVGAATERALQAEQRMRTGRSAPLDSFFATARCRRGRARRGDGNDWRYACTVRFLRFGGRGGEATYGVRVDPRGCFAASSGDFAAQVFERILARRSPNPLRKVRSCP